MAGAPFANRGAVGYGKDCGDAMAAGKQLFAVIAVSKPDMLRPNIDSLFPGDLSMSVGQGQWLLIGPNTMNTGELSAKLGLSGELGGSTGIVLRVDRNLCARTDPQVWKWLNAILDMLF